MSISTTYTFSAHAKAYSRPQQGQALTELLVVALVLVPLFLLIPVIAKYQDISHHTHVASRYAAFAAATRGRTLNTPDRSRYLSDNIRRRIFSNSDAPVKTNDVPGNFKAHQNLFWRDPADHSLIKEFSDIQLSFGMHPEEKKNRSFTPSADGTPFMLKEALNLPARGIYTVNVSVKLANLPAHLRFYEPFDKLDLTMTSSTSLLLNPWTAWSPKTIENHLNHNAAVFPVGALQAYNSLIEPAVASIDLPAQLSAPKMGKLDFWKDVVPADRLSAQ